MTRQVKGGAWVVVIATPLLTLVLMNAGFKVVTLTFDGRRRELVWSRRGLFVRAGGVRPFDAIRGTHVQTLTSGDGTSYRLAVVVDDGDIPQSAAYGTGDAARCRAIAGQIDDFLTLPPLAPEEQSALATKRAWRDAAR